MIRAVIFDLDGTLVQTERLKALSYARAAVEFCPCTIGEEQVLGAYGEVVGLPRPEVTSALVERFDLEERARARMDEFRVSAPWQAFVQVRLRYYEAMISDSKILRDSQWPHNLALLQKAREMGCKTALATMSGSAWTRQVLQALGLVDAFDLIATRDDVERGKPDPEIYQLVCAELQIPAGQSLVIEDSPPAWRRHWELACTASP